MKILYLIPPSEGKTSGGVLGDEKLRFDVPKPLDFLESLTEKDLKCTGKRYSEACELHKKILKGDTLEVVSAIERYTGVMYSAIDYEGMNQKAKKYFDTHFIITSGLYGLLVPQDMIASYKLPIEVKGLSLYWKDILTEKINELTPDIIVDFLPLSYKKMIDWKQLNATVLRVDFLIQKNGVTQKISHGVKKIKGEYIKNICEKEITDIKDFGGDTKQLNPHEFICNVFVEELQ